MPRKTVEKPYFEGCPVEFVLDLIGGKWKGVTLYHLLRTPVMRFGELKKLMPNVTQRMLTKQLRELETDGILSRKVYATVPPKVEYSMTDKGRSLERVVDAMAEWGERYRGKPSASSDAVLNRPNSVG